MAPAPASQRHSNKAAIVQIGKLLGRPARHPGWYQVFSYTNPAAGLFAYSQWLIGVAEQRKEWQWQAQKKVGKKLLVQFADDGMDYEMGTPIAIHRHQLLPLAEGEFYRCDLIGWPVLNHAGSLLGHCRDFWEGPEHDLLLVQGAEKQLLIPWVRPQIFYAIDAEKRCLRANWELDYAD